MKLFILNIIIIAMSLGLLFSATILLDVEFIKGQPVRSVLIYVLMLLVVFVTFRIIILINTTKE